MKTIRVLSLFGALLVGLPLGRAQPAQAPLNIYATALVEAAGEMQRSWGHMERAPSQLPVDYRNRIVSRDDSVLADYPSTAGDLRFEFRTYAELHRRRRQIGKNFAILRVHAATVEGPRVKVVVAQNWISIHKRALAIEISDWGAVYFRLDPSTNQFRFDEVKLGGI